MDIEKAGFLRNEFIPLLKSADPASTARWGRMNFRQMVEHMVLTFKSANGKLVTDQSFTAPDKIAAFQDFLRSDKEFRENTKSPALPEEPLPVHYPSLEFAIAKLETEVRDFFHVYETTPGLKLRNPIFGDLDYDLAVRLLYKHTQHHLKQFGLL